MFDDLSLPSLLLVFIAAATAVWIAGVQLSNTTDVLSTRLGLGEALGGLILLAIATNLPEIAITTSAALSGSLGVAVGNILGGIAIQTVVLVILDIFGVGPQDPLTYRAASLVLVLEGILVTALLGVVVMGSQLPASLIFVRVDPGALAIFALWVVGVWLLAKAREGLPWHGQGDAPGGEEGRGDAGAADVSKADQQQHGTARTVLVFAVAAVVTLVAGVILERSGESIATDIGMNGLLFGATILAAATALPEVSTGLTAVRLGDYQLAISDIFGGNSFLPVLFLLATLLSGQAVLPSAQDTDIYLTALGILLTTVYTCGLIFRPRRQMVRMGIDSIVVVLLYAVGIWGLVEISRR